jgi:hypothetical protein
LAPAAYASRTVLPPSLQDSLPAGWLAFAGRASNPLDRCKRFQIIHPPFLDFAWRKGSFMAFPPEMQWDDNGGQAMRSSLTTVNSTF